MTKEPRADLKDFPGLYYVDPDGQAVNLEPGTYFLNEEGSVRPAPNWQVAIDKVPWERIPEVIESHGKRGLRDRQWILVATYLLVVTIVIVGLIAALYGILDGQALVGLLGASLGYLFGRGRGGGLLGQA